jgi:hypothetical protein
MNTALLLLLLSAPSPEQPPERATARASAAALVIGEPPPAGTRTGMTPELLQHEDGGVTIRFPEGYLMRTTLRRGFNGVWFTDCGAVPTRSEPRR